MINLLKNKEKTISKEDLSFIKKQIYAKLKQILKNKNKIRENANYCD